MKKSFIALVLLVPCLSFADGVGNSTVFSGFPATGVVYKTTTGLDFTQVAVSKNETGWLDPNGLVWTTSKNLTLADQAKLQKAFGRDIKIGLVETYDKIGELYNEFTETAEHNCAQIGARLPTYDELDGLSFSLAGKSRFYSAWNGDDYFNNRIGMLDYKHDKSIIADFRALGIDVIAPTDTDPCIALIVSPEEKLSNNIYGTCPYAAVTLPFQDHTVVAFRKITDGVPSMLYAEHLAYQCVFDVKK
jgi:hypothetical protein